ncbi:MAG TPA: hypothetical protein VFA33_17465 [Bryobacteraceae bacterium]|nr:hypothetical protein [Bryobacteraceae bacterium]
MKVKFQADNDLDRAIVHGVVRRRATVDFRSQPMDAVDDLTVLHLAAQESRILVSHDVSSMPAAFAQYRRTSHSPGVLLVPQTWPLADAIEQLVLIWELTEAGEWVDRICYLPTLSDFRVRG